MANIDQEEASRAVSKLEEMIGEFEDRTIQVCLQDCLFQIEDAANDLPTAPAERAEPAPAALEFWQLYEKRKWPLEFAMLRTGIAVPRLRGYLAGDVALSEQETARLDRFIEQKNQFWK